MKTGEAKQDLLLLGAGHSHVLVLRRLAMRPMSGVRVTLVSESSHAPYSGMLPGLVAGHYQFEDMHIDLRRYCAQLGVRFIKASVQGLQLEQRRVLLADRPPLGYDILSLNTGSQPELASVPGAREFAVPVKPVAGFSRRWQALQDKLCNASAQGVRIVVVGGGAGSVELALAMRYRLGSAGVQVELVCGRALLESYNAAARRVVYRHLQQQGIALREFTRVEQVESSRLRTEQGQLIDYDELVWCTAASAPGWLRAAGLACDEQGFLLVDSSLRALGQAHIFGAGDVASLQHNAHPKAGVYAVRQAPVLAHNLRVSCLGGELHHYQPQRRFLSLLALGKREAVAERGPLWASGAWVWRWKDHIDRRFMRQFTVLPQMSQDDSGLDPQAGVMHCGGCGAKLPAKLLREVLAEMARRFPSVVASQAFSDDAAQLQQTPGKLLLQSVDSLRELTDDPWLMGRIAALHALSDIYAMGARPHSCLAQITLPYAGVNLQYRDLELLMDGALHEMAAASCQLLGGHSLEGAELSIGFTVNGEVDAARLLAKTGVAAGDHLVLTKALGSGVLFAAHSRGDADGRWIDAALEGMLLGNARAAELAEQFGLRAGTDVTGFGLAGHLLEMLSGQALQACISLAALPLLPGVVESFAAGCASTLAPGNREAVAAELEVSAQVNGAQFEVLFDPQTSGGLLLAVPAAQVAALLASLRAAGYDDAVDIGELRSLPVAAAQLLLQP